MTLTDIEAKQTFPLIIWISLLIDGTKGQTVADIGSTAAAFSVTPFRFPDALSVGYIRGFIVTDSYGVLNARHITNETEFRRVLQLDFVNFCSYAYIKCANDVQK